MQEKLSDGLETNNTEVKISQHASETTDKNAYHPGLPSTQGAKKNYDTIASDHIPFLATFPCPKNTATLDEIKIVSWNVLESDSGNGFSEKGAPRMRYCETDEQRTDRHQNIATGLAKFVQNNKPEFITLQEIFITNEEDNYSLLNAIKKVLGDDFECVKVPRKGIEERKNSQGEFEEHEVEYVEPVDSSGCITLYNKNLFKPSLVPDLRGKDDLIHKEMNGSITKFVSVTDPNLEVRISSAHHDFNEQIIHHENHIKKFLTDQDSNKLPVDKNKNTLSIVIGDFNGSIGPLIAKEKNTITSVAPPGFREDGLQGAWAIDGAFYTMDNINCKQATTIQLNHLTGMPYNNDDLSIARFAHLDTPQQTEVNRLRPIICVDESYKTKVIKKLDYTLFTYEAKLRSDFQDETIYVREARSLKDEAGITIMANDLGYYFSLLNNPLFQTSLKNDSFTCRPTYFISAPNQNIKELNNTINFIVKNKELYEFSKKLRQIPREHPVYEKFKALLISLHTKNIDLKNPTYSTIIEHMSAEAEKITKVSTPSFKEVQKSARDLDSKLKLTRPMNPKIKLLVCGIIGALVGAALGTAVGFTLGGLGAVPGGIFGAFEGFAIGTAIATGALSLGAILGSSLGFFSGKRNNRVYQEEKSKLNEDILNNVEDIYSNLKQPG